jgi:hypothetical protein
MLAWTKASASPSTSSPSTSPITRLAVATWLHLSRQGKEGEHKGQDDHQGYPRGKRLMSFVSDYCTYFFADLTSV